ncbi:cytochrome c oxidase subunit 6C-1 [Betta splendens]|uniref:Cytochrome c oxidase subunit 6C n=1 Tax=Betta splendens TaxID=158456 RepID=A0A6P7MJW9_BETSP|nr:cytochrome c oxidase subunit 6C-1 [Betta splendens]
MSLPKPMMRGLLAKRTRIVLPMAFVSCGGLALFYKYVVGERRKRTYAEFYKNYDATKDFNAMREAGVFDSVQPSGK